LSDCGNFEATHARASSARAFELAKIVFFVAILLFLIAAIFGAVGGRRPVV
jgi:hypothetical protein